MELPDAVLAVVSRTRQQRMLLSAMTCYTVHFEGHVQGVGFRYRACEVAQAFAVSGTVENLQDGRVRLVAEGEADQVDGLLAAILRAMAGHVRRHTIDKTPATGEFGVPGDDPLRIKR
ncbi:MAG: acylphosphatase [Planctomycetota bacterium]|nr:acylphosphatase [Planctomycetota bacterium]